MKRFGWLICVLFLAACGAQATETPTPLPTATPGPSPTVAPSPTATRTPTITPSPTATPIPTATPGSGMIHASGVFSDNVDPARNAFYTLGAEVGDAVRIAVTPEDEALDLRLVVTGPGQRELARVDRNGPGEAEMLPEFQFPVNGIYQINVEAVAGAGFMQGNLVYLSPEARTGGGAFTSFEDPPMAARLVAPDTFHVYTFDAPLGQIVILQAVAEEPDLDLFFYLFQPDGTLMDRYDDELPPNNPALYDRLLPQEGQYTAFIGAKAGTGAYQVILQPGG